jgi:5-methylcytosine-specific restriction enzyme A
MTSTWAQTPKRPALSRKQRVAIYMKTDGRCYICGQKIRGGAWEAEHPIARQLGGTDAPEALMPCCIPCHKRKTAKDASAIAKSKRIRDKHIGALKSETPMKCGRNSPYKRKMNGKLVWRDTGEPVR